VAWGPNPDGALRVNMFATVTILSPQAATLSKIAPSN